MRFSTALLAGLVMAGGMAAAVAQGDGFGYLPYPGEEKSGLYVALRGSMAFRGKDGATSVPAAPPVALRGSHDTGYGGAIAVGAKLPYGFNAELEGVWRHRPYDSMTMGGITTAATGFRDTGAVMGNIVWEAPLHEYGVAVTPFIGGGVGLAYTQARLSDNPTSTNLYLASSSNLGLAWQGMAGFKVDVAPGARLTAAYRYMQVNGARSACGTGGAPTLTCRRDTVDQGVDVGLELDL